ncbi:MAG: hypothetical protein M1548_01630, partial [Actinobacteria bacterium]|nr:hypothetical protein [Actinomycetota bacterium]
RNPKLLAAELVDYEGRARQVLSGGDPNYRRALATYQASDCSRPDYLSNPRPDSLPLQGIMI